jgi:pimeloyl-ACP methyl ester carboxylesterase
MPIPLDVLQDTPEPNYTLHLSHANGFPPLTYQVLVNHLPQTYRVVGLQGRALWQPTPPIEEFTSWETIADDLLAGLDELQLDSVIGVGHSMGGVATLIASVKQPQRFKAMILLDPTLLPPILLWAMRLVKNLPGIRRPLIEQARTRKRSWESLEAAFERYRPRPLFQGWPDEALYDYIRAISQPDANGTLHLVYSPEWEARIYETIPLDGWSWVPRITVPTLVICGAQSDTFRPRSARHWRKLRPDLAVISIPQAGHFVPMQAAETVAHYMVRFISTLDS